MIEEDQDLSSELWSNIFSFLDVKDLCNCERINKNFTSLARQDSLWKALCKINFPLLTEPKNDLTNWKEYYQYVLGLDVAGKHSLYSYLANIASSTSVDIAEETNWPLYQKSVNIEQTKQKGFHLIQQIFTNQDHPDYFNKLLPSIENIYLLTPTPPPPLLDQEAPWGKFTIIGCKYGNHFAFLHIYEGHGYFTNYHVELKEGVLRGNWKTNWQELTGLCIYDTCPQLDNKIRDKFVKFDHDFSHSNTFEAEKLLGEWNMWFFTDCDNQDMTIANFQILLSETSCHALRGSVARSFVRDSLVIGCLQDDAISLSIVTAPENATTYKFFSLIGKIDKDLSFINGRVVIEDNEKLYCGIFYGIKKKENVHKKMKHN